VRLRAHWNGLSTALVLALLCPAQSAWAGETILIPAGAVWSYLDDGSDPGTGWREPGFDESGWPQGPSQLGFGDADEATELEVGPEESPLVTAYFRHSFALADPGEYASLSLSLLRDDGAVVYLNGSEVARSNMPLGDVDAFTRASVDVSGEGEATFLQFELPQDVLVAGENVVAVEVHQSSRKVKDCSFDLALTAASPAAQLERPPYLQRGTPTSVVVRWRTTAPTDARLLWGSAPGSLTSSLVQLVASEEHEFEITGLSPGSRVYYAVGTTDEILAGDDPDHYFTTSPPVGTRGPIRIWVVGDSGSCGSSSDGCRRVGLVRDAYLGLPGSESTDVWLMLGDNAYSDGRDSEYTRAVFEVFPTLLRRTVLWPAPGNHEFGKSDSSTQSGPYYDSFTLPSAGEAGGLASGTEAYYSFDYGNVHFVALDSHDTDRSAPADPVNDVCAPGEGGAMYQWLCADLAATSQDFVIAYWHHPPYSKGSHNSDGSGRMEDMRKRFVPVLEDYGVDLQLTGHSHSYERSILLDGHYERSSHYDPALHAVDPGNGDPGGDGPYLKEAIGPAPHQGAVYTVVGSSSRLSGGDLDHPVMAVAVESLGSLVLDVVGRQLDGVFVDETGAIRDHFRIVKGPPLPVCDDGLDNDGDGWTDLADPVCEMPERSWERAQCQDGLDNDGDGTVDFDGGLASLGSALTAPDPQCEAQPWRIVEREELCGLGFELVLVLLPWLWLQRRRRGARLP
jgi:hypothetical protein